MKITLEFPNNKQKEFEALLLSWRMDNSQRFEVNDALTKLAVVFVCVTISCKDIVN